MSNSPCETLIFASKILHVCTYLIFWRERVHSFHQILKDVCDSKMIKNHYSSPTLMSFASEKNKVIISESEVSPTLSTSILPCHRNSRQEVKEKFPGKRRLKSRHGPWTHPGVHILSWRERERDFSFTWRYRCLSRWQKLHPFQSDEVRLLRQMLSKSWTCEVLLRVQEITGYKSAWIISAHANSMLGHSGSGNTLFFLCNDFWCCGLRRIRLFRAKRGILIDKIVKCQKNPLIMCVFKKSRQALWKHF